MHVKVWRTVASATMVLSGSMVLMGCGDSGSTSDASPDNSSAAAPVASATATPDADAAARTVIDNYLAAMKTKDVAKGREQLCATLQPGFDQNATGPNGDFANHFVVNEVKVDKVEAAGKDRKVTTTVIAAPATGGDPTTLSVLFTVQAADSRWCISNEALAP